MKSIAGVPKDFSLKEKKRAVGFVEKNPGSVNYLIDVFLTTHYRESQKLAGVLEAIGKRNPALIQPHLRKLILMLDSPKADTALKRNIPRILQWMQISVNLQGRAVNACFRLLSDPTELVAAKVFSMTVLANIAREQPGLANEIRTQIELQYDLSTAAFRSRAKKVIKMLER